MDRAQPAIEQPILRDEQRTSRAPAGRSSAAVVSLLGTVFQRSLAIFLLLALWEAAPRLGLVEPAFLPPLSEVVTTAWELVHNGQLMSHLTASLQRSLFGFGMAISFSVPLGLLIGSSRRVEDFLFPILEAARNTPALALLPVFILFFGIGETSKVALIIYACSWPILLNTISGVRGVDPLLIKSARTMGVTQLDMLRKVVLPAALPTVFTGVRLAGANSLLALVAAEMVGATAGLGYLIQYSQFNFKIAHMYVGILTITIVGLLFARSLQWVERRFTRWKS
jgi:NitT/TauT family transport system permease protein